MTSRILLFLVSVFAGWVLGQWQPIALAQQETASAAMPDITLREVLDTLADYNVSHETSGLFARSFYGVTDSKSKTIYISDNFDIADRRETLLHEFLHAEIRKRGVFESHEALEVAIDAKAQEIYRRIYGGVQ